MAHVFVEEVGEEGLKPRSSYFVSPGPLNQTECVSSLLEKAFGHSRGLLDRLKTLQVPDKAYLELYLLQMHRCNFKLWTIHQSLSTLSRFLFFLNSDRGGRVREVKR